jgi:replicative DNA helicase
MLQQKQEVTEEETSIEKESFENPAVIYMTEYMVQMFKGGDYSDKVQKEVSEISQKLVALRKSFNGLQINKNVEGRIVKWNNLV